MKVDTKFSGNRVADAEERLALSEESLRLATEAGAIGTWDFDLNADRLTWSDKTKAVFGFSPDADCTIRDFYAGLHPDDRERISALFASSIDPAVRSVYDVEYRTIGKEDGVLRWVAAKGCGIFDANGRCVRAIGVAIDITDRKRTELMGAEQAALLELVAKGRPLEDCLTSLCATVPRLHAETRASLLVANEDCKAFESVFSSPDLEAFSERVRCLGIGKYAPSTCGVAVYDALPIVCADIANDLNRGREWRKLCLAEGIRACLSTPVLDASGKAIASFMLCFAEAREPSPWERELGEFGARIASIALDRHSAGLALARSEDRLRLALEAGRIGTWSLDIDGNTSTRSALHDAIFGYAQPIAEWSFEHFLSHVALEDRKMVGERFRAAAHSGRDWHFECRIDRADGRKRWIEAKGASVRNTRGIISGYAGTVVDITDRKLNEESLEQRVAERTRERDRTWNNSQDLLVVVGADGILQAVNPAWTAVLGWQQDELVQRRDADFIHPDDQAESKEARAHASERTLRQFENRVRHKDGSYRCISWVATPEDNLIYATGRDVTAEKQAAERLRQAQKMEAVGQLTGGVAHDFNNILMVLSGGLGMLERQTDPARRERLLDGMRQAASRGTALTRQLLAFSRRQELKPEPVDLKQRLGGMRELLDRSLRGDVQVEMRFSKDLWPVTADAVELELGLLNLAVNARDAMPDGGTILVEAANVSGPVADLPGGDFVKMSVIDTGVGMSEAVKARVFEPFFTTKDIGHGSGLGLAQVYGFAHQSGGWVEIESEPGKGTAVSLFLPRTTEVPDRSNRADRGIIDYDIPSPKSEKTAGRILLVEDDKEVANLVRDMLYELNFEVTHASNAVAALGALANERSVDLIFSDVMMPGGMSGLELAKEARRRRPNVPILLTTGYVDAARQEAASEGIAVLPKPYELQTLAKAVRAAIGT